MYLQTKKDCLKNNLLDCWLFNQMRHGLWTEEFKKARQERRGFFDLERILTYDTCVKKAAVFINIRGWLTGVETLYIREETREVIMAYVVVLQAFIYSKPQ